MLIKANRFCTGLDFYNPIAPIVQTLHRDRVTGRARDAKLSEGTIYDQLHGASLRFMTSDMSEGKGSQFEDKFPYKWIYSDIDIEEDVILFPEAIGEWRTSI